MQKVILYIQPQLRTTTTAQDYVRVDLMEEELITLTQVIQDVRNIDKVFTDYSRTFNLPASKTNNKIFKWWYNPDVEGFDNQIMCNARIELNHFAFKDGKIRLEEVVLKKGEPSMYKVTFFGNTLSLTDLMGEDQLDNLIWLNNFNFTATDANVKAGLNAGLNITVDSVSYPDAVIYPLLAHSQQYMYDSTGNFDNQGNISYNTSGQDASYYNRRGVLPEDLKPAILVKHIIKAIEEQYSITFKTSEFFDSASVTNFYMWLHRDKGKIVAPSQKLVYPETFTCTSGACSHFTSSAPPIGPATQNGLYTFSGNQTNGFEDGYVFQAQITAAGGYTTTEYTIEIVNNINDQVVATLEDVTGNNNLSVAFGYNSTNPISLTDSFALCINIKSSSSFQFGAVIVCTHYTWNTSTLVYDTYTANFTSSSSTMPVSQDIVITNQIPKIKVIDFLNGLFKMFNLTAYLNFDGEVVVQTLDNYYAAGDTLDITEYVKTDQHTIGETIPYTEIDFEYAEAKSILAEQFFLLNNKKFGELQYISDASKNSTYKLEAPFEHMLFERLQDLNTTGTAAYTEAQYGLFTNQENEPSIGQPLLFYGIYQTSITKTINFVESTRPETGMPTAGTQTQITNYWMPHNASALGSVSTAPTYNLNYGSEINSYTLTDYGGNNNSLFQTYYDNYITRIFNKKTRIFKYGAILPLKVILQLTLNDKIVIGTRDFTINKMTIKLQSGETSLELLNEPT
tara:strand:- start:2429 stop:4639 length:2211 start_codon:yes stop_codon:yes gene_type:complete